VYSHTCNTILRRHSLSPSPFPLKIYVMGFPAENRIRACLSILAEHTVRRTRRNIRLMEAMQDVIIWKNWHVKGLCGRCLSVFGPEPHFAPLHYVYLYTVYLFTEGGGGGESWKMVRETVRKDGSKIPTWLIVFFYLQSINSDKHLPQKQFTCQFF
jgi:hypothetical protein